jgi:hypothetical protein
MAVSLDSYAPFDSGAGATVLEDEWRAMIGLTVASGYVTGNGIVRGTDSEMTVYADSSGDQVKVKAGQIWVNATWGRQFTDITLPIAVGHATLPRIDTIVARVNYTSNVIEVDVLQGVPNASPVAPVVTLSGSIYETQLAQVSVPALDNNIAAGQVYDGRRFQDWPAPFMACSANVVVNNSTTLVDVTGMTMPMSITSIYCVDGWLEYDAATAADVKFQLIVPSGSFGRLWAGAPDSAIASNTGSSNFGSVDVGSQTLVGGGAGVGTRMGMRVSGWLQTSQIQTVADPLTNPFKIKLQFAQNTANASNATVYANSWMRFTRMGF